MNRIKAFLLASLAALVLTPVAAASDPFSINTALSTAPSYTECGISVTAGDVLEFSAEDLERRLNLSVGSLRGATVTALPGTGGSLVLEGVEVDPYDFLTREEIDQLCFVPADGATAAGVTLLPQGADAVSVNLAITVLANQNAPPILEGESYATLMGARVQGCLNPVDPDGDAVSIRLVKKPEKGDVSFSGCSFVYTSYQGAAGSDSFTVCAVDRFHNYSDEAVVEIKIERNRDRFRFQDMHDNPSEYAAVKLHEKGVISGEKIGGGWFFHPGRQVTRGELLIALLAAGGHDSSLEATANTGVEGDNHLPIWLKPYLKKAVTEGLWNTEDPFRPHEIPSRAEAVVLTARAAGITDVKDFTLTVEDLADIPDWALSAYKDLAAYKMLDLHDGAARPAAPLDRDYTADLVWQLYRHHNR